MDNSVFSTILSDYLTSRGITQKWLAVESGVTESTVSRYVTGKTVPDVSVMIKIATTLGMSVDFLCGLTKTPFPRETLDPEHDILLTIYDKMEAIDKRIVWTAMERYMSSEDKETSATFDFAR